MTFDNGTHIGPTSGMSFLYRWHDSKVHPNNDGEATATLSSYGDVPLPRVPRAELPEQAEATDLL